MKRLLGIWAIIFLLIHTSSFTQECGVGYDDQQFIKGLMIRSRAIKTNLGRSDEVLYVPIRFFLVARDDSTGRVPEGDVLQALCVLNEYFKDSQMQFYIKDLHNLNHSLVYSSISVLGSSNLLSFRARSVTIREKIYDAVNVFVVKEIEGAGGYASTDLARDLIVIKSDRLFDNTLAHEIGHLFGLDHVFAGWESTSPNGWDPEIHGNPVGITSPGNTPNEWVDRIGCHAINVADGLCSTPADYLLSYSQPGCVFTLDVKDPAGKILTPMLNNIMNYGFSCAEYIFTDEQKDVMYRNLLTRERDYICSGFEPESTVISGTPELVSPAPQAVIRDYNSIRFEWSEVEGANRYIFELRERPLVVGQVNNVLTTVTDNTWINVDNSLKSNTEYLWRVKAFNNYQTCKGYSSWQLFETNDDLATGIENKEENHTTLVIYPNPVSSGYFAANVWSDDVTLATFLIKDLTGKVLRSHKSYLLGGLSTTEISVHGLPPGLCLLVLVTEKDIRQEEILILR